MCELRFVMFELPRTAHVSILSFVSVREELTQGGIRKGKEGLSQVMNVTHALQDIGAEKFGQELRMSL